ncbi:MAG: metalloregulator ArsR/SmtB family transcription factor [Halanaerobiales bacterium]|nr:metalloregulator ArsR/SmtB family transcription factor [Halanaerobiales bacterium]
MKKLLLFLKCLADENRLSILQLLLNDRFCVCELQEILGKSQSSISQHLSYFKDIDLLIDEKISKRTYYSLNRKKYDKYLSDLLSLSFDPIEELDIENYSNRFEDSNFVITKNENNNSCN